MDLFSASRPRAIVAAPRVRSLNRQAFRMEKMKTQKLGSLVVAGGALAAAFAMASPAAAQPIACTYLSPGMLAAIRPAGPCVYQGDRIAQQGPVYDGPAIVAPQPTYAPSPTVNAAYAPAVRRTVMRRTPAVNRTTVNVEGDVAPAKGKPQVVRANAEVRIYGPERMDIRLYRR
jgi:hypothetical protein